METAQLNRDEKSLLANNMNNSDPNQALQNLLNDADPALHEHILNELSLRHTAWTGLINRENVDTAIVIETGLGATVASLSAIVRRVYAVYLEADKMDLVRKRVSSDSVSHVLLRDFHMHSIENSDKTLFVAYNDEGSREFDKICINIINEKNIKYYYYINLAKLSYYFLRSLQVDKNSQDTSGQSIYHIEGSIRDPFKLTSSENKILQFGKLKYFIYRLYSMVANKHIATTNLSFDESFFCVVANIFFSKNNYKIRDIFFIKPNGALLVVYHSNKEYMLRITSDDLGKRRLSSNNYALGELETLGCSYCPELYKELSVGNYNCSAEKRIAGRNVNGGDLNTQLKRTAVYKQAVDKLINIHTQSLHLTKIDNEVYEKAIGGSISKAGNNLSDEYNVILDNIDKYLKACLLGKTLPLVLSHGDFSADNLMICDEKITGVIDWEYSKNNSLPFVDLVFFFCNVYKKTTNISIVRAMQKIIIGYNIESVATGCSKAYCDSMSISKDHIKPLSLMCAIDFIAYRLENNSLIECDSLFDKNFGPLLKSIDKYISKET